MSTLCDPYQVLMVRRDASAHEIRAAFRRLIGQWHPDVAASPDAHHRSAAIINAYRTLSHPERRSLHDRRQRPAEVLRGHERRRDQRRRASRHLASLPPALRALAYAWALTASVTVAAMAATELPGRAGDITWLVHAP